jgi:hypothetical protein
MALAHDPGQDIVHLQSRARQPRDGKTPQTMRRDDLSEYWLGKGPLCAA